jgi:hypothetical protein
LIHNNFLLTERFSFAADLYDRGKTNDANNSSRLGFDTGSFFPRSC